MNAGKFRSTGAEQAGKVVELRSHLAEVERRRDQALRPRPLTQRPPQPVREIRRVLRPDVDAEILQLIGLLAEQVDPPLAALAHLEGIPEIVDGLACRGGPALLPVLQYHAIPNHEGIERARRRAAQPGDLEAPSGTRVADAVLFVLLGFQNPIQHSTSECPVDAPTLTGDGDFPRIHLQSSSFARIKHERPGVSPCSDRRPIRGRRLANNRLLFERPSPVAGKDAGTNNGRIPTIAFIRLSYSRHLAVLSLRNGCDLCAIPNFLL